jgi:hypothetical protein
VKVTPGLRRAVHQAADLVLDALATDEDAPAKAKVRRARALPPTMPSDVTPEELARVHAALDRAGFRKRT